MTVIYIIGGFNNITFFSSEFFGIPWIWYFPNEEQSGVRSVATAFLNDDMIKNARNKNISDFTAELGPTYPNVHNYHEYDFISRVYTSELILSDRKSEALILEYKENNRVIIQFMYDDLLISILTFNEKLAYEWMKDLSFEKYRG